MEQAEARHDRSPKRVRSGSWAAAQVTLPRAPAPRSVFAHRKVAVSPTEWVRGCQSDSRVGGVSPPSPRWRTSQCQLHRGRAPAVSRAPRGVSQARWAIPPRRSHPLIAQITPQTTWSYAVGAQGQVGGSQVTVFPSADVRVWRGYPIGRVGDRQPRTLRRDGGAMEAVPGTTPRERSVWP